MAAIRPKDAPAVASVAAGDIFLIDGAAGVRALAASVVPIPDANGNVSINNISDGFTTTATAGGTTTLTAASAGQQFFTGTLNQTVVLPVVSTFAKTGIGYFFQNSSTGALTIQSSGGNTVKVLGPGTFADVTCIALTGTSAASWQATYFADIVVSGKVLTLNNSLTLAGTDGSTLNFGVGGTLTGSSNAAVFYDNVPQNSKSAAYTTALADAQKHIFHPAADTTARTWTIDSNANVAYPIGTAITFVNQNGAGIITIAITADTMRLAGIGTTGSRTLGANGLATALKVTSTEWIISGTGLT
jgi:hypothetical protein